jgi:hypothetical protein
VYIVSGGKVVHEGQVLTQRWNIDNPGQVPQPILFKVTKLYHQDVPHYVDGVRMQNASIQGFHAVLHFSARR